MRNLVTRTVVGAFAVSTLAVLLVGCGDEPEPIGQNPIVPPPTTTMPSTSTPASPVFTDIKACDVLAEAIKGTELGAPEESRLAGPNGCSTAVAKYGAASLDLADGRTVDDLVVDRGQLSSITISGRDARLLKGNGGNGNCQISIAAGPTARALVMLTIDDTDQSCRDLRPIAEKVAEQLPAG